MREATAEVVAEQRLREAARTDALTGLFNRRHFSEVLEAELERSRRDCLTPGLLLLDVDHFKAVNDTYGHQVGDAVLSEIATRLRGAVRTLRHRGALGRRGVHRAGAVARARALALAHLPGRAAERRARCRSRSAQRRLDVTVSVGGVLVDPSGSHELIIDQADRALYAAKRQGRDRARLFSELTLNDLAAEEPEAIRLAQALSLSAGVREGVPEQHAEEVAELAGAIASGLGLPEDAVLRCRLGGWLHDIGKVAIPDRILTKPGELDEHEWRIMRTHAEIGEQLVRRIDAVGVAALAVRHHHERDRRQRLPDGLAGEAIPDRGAHRGRRRRLQRHHRRPPVPPRAQRARCSGGAARRGRAGPRRACGRGARACRRRGRGARTRRRLDAVAGRQFRRTTVQRPPCACSSVTASGVASMRQKA